jgi:hypothetical protein
MYALKENGYEKQDLGYTYRRKYSFNLLIKERTA